ncbi:unnamed protein product [Linum tenue]|uniref:Cytochrome P450 n=1 Tax=Linum tenue TaxID=586396 RepID=A0AAV0NAH6_9ROSI|nr:unnamed protein product [Linum tenue]
MADHFSNHRNNTGGNLAFCIDIIGQKIRSRGATASLPPGPRGLPIVGYLPFLMFNGKNIPLHRQFTHLAAQYGPIFKIRVGSQLQVVVSSPSLAKQVLRDNESIFSSRDLPLAIRVWTYGGLDLSSLPMSQDWNSMRKVVLREVLSNPSLDRCYELRRSVVVKALRELVRSGGKPVGVLELANKMVANATMAMTWGGRDDDGDVDNEEARRLCEEVMALMEKPNVSDVFPLLARFDLQGIGRKVAEVAGHFDRIITSVIQKRFDGKGSLIMDDGREMKDLLQVLLENRERSGAGSPLASITQFKALLLDITPGGTGMVATVIEWAMTELLRCDKAMTKVKRELDDVVRLEGLVEDHHLKKLDYLDAVVKETFRLHLTVIQREAVQPCTIGGYAIPKKAKVMINAWAIHRDPRLWEEPSEFRPERFLDNGRPLDFVGSSSDFVYIPFGSGRRMCVGFNLATRLLKYVLASLLHSFDWKLPAGEGGSTVDVSDEFTLIIKKKKPLTIVPTPRLSCSDLHA